MKSKIHSVCLRLILAGSVMLTSKQILALGSNNNQLIHIDSSKQIVDIATNTLILNGNVVVKHASIDIRADKVVITRPDGKDGNEVVEGFGHPVIFYQLQNNGKPIRGYSQKVRYEPANDLVILSGNAYLEQLDSNVKSDRIVYLVSRKKIEAFSDKNKQVATVLVPTQLQNKSSTITPTKLAK